MVKRGGSRCKGSNRRNNNKRGGTVKKGGSLFGASMKALGSALVPLVFFQSARTYSKKSRGKRYASKKTRRNRRRRSRR